MTTHRATRLVHPSTKERPRSTADRGGVVCCVVRIGARPPRLTMASDRLLLSRGVPLKACGSSLKNWLAFDPDDPKCPADWRELYTLHEQFLRSKDTEARFDLGKRITE